MSGRRGLRLTASGSLAVFGVNPAVFGVNPAVFGVALHRLGPGSSLHQMTRYPILLDRLVHAQEKPLPVRVVVKQPPALHAADGDVKDRPSGAGQSRAPGGAAPC